MIVATSVALRRAAVLAALLLSASGCASQAKPAAAPTIHGALGTVSTPVGDVLTDRAGKTLYRFAPDTPGMSVCTASCLQYWPIVTAAASVPSSVEGVTAAIGSITRADGAKQLTVSGYPVYTYVGDKAPAQISGQGKNLSGGQWWVLSPAGSEITTIPAPASGGGGGGYGGGGYG